MIETPNTVKRPPAPGPDDLDTPGCCTPPPIPDPSEFGTLWQFHHRDGRREVPDPLPPSAGNLDEQLDEAGYDVLLDLGHDAATLSLTVYVHSERDHYLVCLTGIMAYRLFAVADGPSLLAILPLLVRMAKDAAEVDEHERQYEERAKRRRRGPTYNARERRMDYEEAVS